ncbi:MAG: GIY-YIG nuclease family protein [bacterium]|nr:GIY-YIG nuclease family protein [bacterium]
MNYFVYILYSQKDKKLYIGQTSKIDIRLKEHFGGKVKSTKNRRPLLFIKSEIYKSRSEAMRREKFLKSLFGYKERIRLLKEFLSDGSSRS